LVIMGSVKKKLTKTLRKITPKEIAPILPLVAMALPGIGGIASNALLRYGLPQLLTAAASARTSGKINPLNQALAAFSSYAAAPDAAGQLTGKEKAFLETDKGMEFLGGAEGTGATGQALRADPSFAEAVKASGVKSATPGQDFLTGLKRTVGDPIRGLGQGEFNFKNLATVGALGATPAGIDAAKQYEKEQEELAAYEAGLFDDYDSAVQEYIAAMSGMQADPGRLYGLPNLFAAQGGRVSAQDGGPISGITDMVNQSIDQMQDNLSQQIQGGFTTQETIVPVDEAPANTMTQPQGIQAMPNVDLFRQRLQGRLDSNLQQQKFPNLSMGQSLGQTQQRFMPLGGPFGGPSTLAYQRQRQGRPGISSLFNFAEGGMATAPGMPQGMQVDGRNGTFIPMGVKEKADDVPAMLSKNEFVMTADAVRAAGGGSVEKGAQRMYDLMNSLEARV
jgi:hypothetical protein